MVNTSYKITNTRILVEGIDRNGLTAIPENTLDRAYNIYKPDGELAAWVKFPNDGKKAFDMKAIDYITGILTQYGELSTKDIGRLRKMPESNGLSVFTHHGWQDICIKGGFLIASVYMPARDAEQIGDICKVLQARWKAFLRGGTANGTGQKTKSAKS